MGKRGKRKMAAASKAKNAVKAIAQPQNTQPALLERPATYRTVLSKLCRKSVGVWSVAVSAVGLLSILALRPDISIEPYATTDPTRPFEQQFFVQNNSIYPIYKVIPLCGLQDVKTPASTVHGLSITNTLEHVETLDPRVKTTLTCFWTTEQTQQGMEIIPWVKYKTPFGIPRCKTAKFKGKPAVGGTYIWTYDGSDPCPAS